MDRGELSLSRHKIDVQEQSIDEKTSMKKHRRKNIDGKTSMEKHR